MAVMYNNLNPVSRSLDSGHGDILAAPLSRKIGAYKTNRTRIWSQLSGESPSTGLSRSLLAPQPLAESVADTCRDRWTDTLSDIRRNKTRRQLAGRRSSPPQRVSCSEHNAVSRFCKGRDLGVVVSHEREAETLPRPRVLHHTPAKW